MPLVTLCLQIGWSVRSSCTLRRCILDANVIEQQRMFGAIGRALQQDDRVQSFWASNG